MADDHDHKSTSLARRVAGGTLGRLRHLARRSKHRLAHVVESGVADLGEAFRDQLLDLLSSPEQVERLQQALVTISGWAMVRGFRADPNAELLFDFVDWIEERHGRHQVALRLVQSPLLQDPAFVEALAHLTRSMTPFGETGFGDTDDDHQWSAKRLDAFKAKTGRRLLDLLVEFAALEASAPPPAGMTARIEYFEEAPIPLRFTRLAAMTQGDKLLRRPAQKRSALARRVLAKMPSGISDNSLAPFVPGVGDQTLHFLVFSTSFFLQTYLLRNLIEALPELAQDLDNSLRDDDDIIDLH